MMTLYEHLRVGEHFPGGPVVKNTAANPGDMGSIPGLGRPSRAAGQLSPCATTTEPAH